MTQHTVALSDLQAAANQEGKAGRVITAVSWDGGQITYLSYGWSQDTSTVYETQVSTAAFDSVTTVAQGLANQGYIITATGGTLANGILLIGTRVQGDTLARPILIAQPPQQDADILSKEGYATVGLLYNINASGQLLANYWIGER